MTKKRIQYLPLMELNWLLGHTPVKTVRHRLLRTAIAWRKKHPRTRFDYQQAGFNKQQVYQANQRYEQLKIDWNGEAIREQIKAWIAALMQEQSINLAEAIDLIEKDAAMCKARNCFGLPNAEQLRFLLKTLKEACFFARRYDLLQRVIGLDDFYQPYFEVNTQVRTYIRKMNYSIRYLDWQKLEDMWGITSSYLSKYNHQLSIKNKLSLIRFLMTRYHYDSKDFGAIAKSLKRIAQEYSQNPYYYAQEYASLNLVTFFNNYTHIGYYQKAIQHFERPNLDLDSKDFRANVYVYLGIALDAYDLDCAKQYVTKLEGQSIEVLRPIILHLIARYYLLVGQTQKMQPYLEASMQQMDYSKSEELHGEIYSIQFRYLIGQDKPEALITLNSSPKVRTYRQKYQKLSAHNIEMRLYFLLAKYWAKHYTEETFNEKLYSLLMLAQKQANGFLKIKLVENLNRLLAMPQLRIESRNRKLTKALYQEIEGYLGLVSLELKRVADLPY